MSASTTWASAGLPAGPATSLLIAGTNADWPRRVVNSRCTSSCPRSTWCVWMANASGVRRAHRPATVFARMRSMPRTRWKSASVALLSVSVSISSRWNC